MKRACLAVIVLCLGLAVANAGIYSGGSGTAADPYQIASADNWITLTWTEADWTKCFVLTADIELAGKTPIPVGYRIYGGSTPFYGVMDGNGHVIRNLTMKSWSFDTHGLFGYIASTAKIKNLVVVNADIQGGYSTGALVGINNKGTITSCYASGSVAGTGGQIGGLVGDNSGTISSCYSTASVTGGADAVGGLVGINWGTVTTCYATGAVSGANQIGGLVGANYNNGGGVRQCYSIGPVSGTGADVGGLVGWNNGTVQASFWDKETSSRTTSAGGTGKTTYEMKILSTFTDAGWDFTITDGDPADWIMLNNMYPKLAWDVYSGGRGTQGNPYQIGTSSDWRWLIANPTDWDKHFILVRDIDFSGELGMTPVAPDIDGNTSGFQGIPFNGRINGNHHVLRNLEQSTLGANNKGLFGQLGSNSVIENLGIENVYISVGPASDCFGVLCAQNLGRINRSYTTGVLKGKSGSYYSGGLCGRNNGIISGCYATTTLVADGENCGSWGGLCGFNDGGMIWECYSTGALVGGGVQSKSFGGMCGDNSGEIITCYATGPVMVLGLSSCLGGLCGSNRGTIQDCYATGRVNGGIDSYYAVGGLCGRNDPGGINQ